MKKFLLVLWALLIVQAQDFLAEDLFAEEEAFFSEEGNLENMENMEDILIFGSGIYDTDNPNDIDQNESTPLPQSVIAEMSSRKMRYHHYLWHQVREDWNRFTPEVQARYTEIGWAPPNPARNYDAEGRSSAVLDNLSGEDFLYMHRQMIKRVNEIVTQNNESYGNVTGWKKIPGPGDEEWPVPDLYNASGNALSTASSNEKKTDAFFKKIQEAEAMFTDPEQLKNMSLAEMGARIEVTIHSWLHLRFSANCSYGFRNSYKNRTNLPYIDPKWDDPQYDWMGDSYSSHVNAAFYKVHGWIDDRIEDWRIAHNMTEIIWNSTWEGGPAENITSLLDTKEMMITEGSGYMDSGMDSGMSHSGGMNVMEDALDIFLKSGVPETTFADEVLIDGKVPFESESLEKKTSASKPVIKARRLCQSRR